DRPGGGLGDAAPRRRRGEPGLSAGLDVGPLADAPVRRRARRGAPEPDRPARAAQARLKSFGGLGRPPRFPPSEAPTDWTALGLWAAARSGTPWPRGRRQ